MGRASGEHRGEEGGKGPVGDRWNAPTVAPDRPHSFTPKTPQSRRGRLSRLRPLILPKAFGSGQTTVSAISVWKANGSRSDKRIQRNGLTRHRIFRRIKLINNVRGRPMHNGTKDTVATNAGKIGGPLNGNPPVDDLPHRQLLRTRKPGTRRAA